MKMNEPIFGGSTTEENLRMQQYFNTLPAYVQETLYQSGMMLSNIEELQSYAETMMNKQEP